MGTFWAEVKAQVLAGGAVILITATAGGIFYLAYTVPSQLAQILKNQEEFKTDLDTNRRDTLENTRKIGEHDGRLIRLETLSGVKK